MKRANSRDGSVNLQGIAALPTSYHNQTDEQNDDFGSRDAAQLAWRVEVAAALAAAGYAKEAELFTTCSDPGKIFTVDYSADLPAGSIGVYVCEADPHHHAKAIAPTCKLRICPDCASSHTARLLARYVPELLDLEMSSDNDFSCKHVTLTTPISLDDPDLKEKIAELMKAVPRCFDVATGYDWRKDSGLLFAFEFGEEGRKLHFHAIWFGQFIPQPTLSAAWSSVTDGLASVVWIEQLDRSGTDGRTLEAACAEVCKYATKLAHRNPDGSWRWMPADDVVKLFIALKGSRRVRSYGLLYAIEEPERPHVCPVCASAMLKLAPVEWTIWRETGWLPDEFKEALKPPILNLILGNNFSGVPPPENNVFKPSAVALPGFERFVTRQQWLDMVN